MCTQRKINSLLLMGILLLVAILLIPLTSSAQDVGKYPTKPITYIVMFGPGGGADLTGRVLCKVAEGILGQPTIVENRAGGGGVIGINLTSKAKPDGYTIGGFSFSGGVIAPHLQDVPYKTKEDFSFICQYADFATAFVVRPDAPWKTWNDFIEDARKNPGKRTYTTTGPRSGDYIFFQQICIAENVKLQHIPYASDAEMKIAVLGGHVDAGFIGAIGPYIRSGEFRALVVRNEQRWKIIPNVPTFQELGVKAEVPTWIGVVGPKGIPGEILQKLEKAFEKAANDPEVHNLLEKIQMLPHYRSAEEFKKVVLRDYDMQGEIIKKLGLKEK